MALPGNGIFVVRGEMSILMTAMRRGARWSHHQDDDDHLMRNFQHLKEILCKINDLHQIEPNTYLGPFLEVIKSEETTGPVTSLALSAVNKFLAYGLIDPTHGDVAKTVHSIADAVTYARFVGTDQSSDGVVLMRILQVLRTLTLAPEGAMLTNESLCEIMLSCFRICFETRLNELLRRTAEHYLKDMVQLVFMRLPQFSEDLRNVKQFKMRPGAGMEPTRTKRKNTKRAKSKSEEEQQTPSTLKPPQNHLSTTPLTPAGNIVDMQGAISQTTPLQQSDETTSPASVNSDENPIKITVTDEQEMTEKCPENNENNDFINQRGIRFTPQVQNELLLMPYGMACVRELFRFLISLCNPMDKQNTDVMIHLGLTLLTVAFEVGSDTIGKYQSLLILIKDDLCRNLFSLLNSERVSVFAADLQVCFLLFESLRTHLKFQLEYYLTKLIDIIITMDSSKITYEHKEIALDNILQLWRIPGFVTELYLNYDCNIYCTNLYEDLTKLLAKNAFSATSGLYHIHMLSLDALLTVVENIEKYCANKGTQENENNVLLLDKKQLMANKNIKKWLPTGTEHFNHKPKKGIQFLQEHGILKSELDPYELAIFLKENTNLDKKMIGEFISSRNNLNILEAFVKTFDFTDMRIDEALRHYLETFRLPGEAPTISLVLEQFAEHWHKSNGEPFADVDSTFVLAYAVIMLNVDQHNQNAKKQTIPMSLAGFKKNLTGLNGGSDFDEEMLDEIYNAIKNEEIVMPVEQTGLVRENYLWKMLLRKGASKDGTYFHTNTSQYNLELFNIIWSPIMAALSFVYDKSEEEVIYKKAISGFEYCAFISNYYNETKNLDMLIVTLSKFTNFQTNNNLQQKNAILNFGGNLKARLALKCCFNLSHQFGDNIRQGWRNLFDLILYLHMENLLPKSYIDIDDFIESNGKITLKFEPNENNNQKQDTGLLSSLYSYMLSENLKMTSIEEQNLIDLAQECIRECNLEQLVTDSKFLHDDSLNEILKTLIDLSKGPDMQKSLGYDNNYNESITVFYLELLVKIVIQNRDRVMTIWQLIRDHLYTLVMNASVFDYQFLLERSVIDLLRIAIRLMRNEEMSPIVLQSLRMLLLLKGATLSRISRQVSYGLYELLKTSAQNIHTKTDWTIVFTLLECVGAGAQPPKPIMEQTMEQQGETKSDGEINVTEPIPPQRGYTSDSELTKSPKPPTKQLTNTSSGGWILVGNEIEIQPIIGGRTFPPNQYNLSLEKNLGQHDPSSLIKCCESLAFLVRDVAHITPYNFDDCVHCIRTFVEASLHGNKRNKKYYNTKLNRRKINTRRRAENRRHPISSISDDSEEEDLPSGYHQISIQLLDLMHTLHTRTAQIFRWWAEEVGSAALITQQMSLWTQGWCPLLQGIARLCCDVRRDVRMSAITYLQRALLVHDLQTLTGQEWEQCFHRVLFPLLTYLLQTNNSNDHSAMEETRMRAATVLSKVFLHHLTPLLSLPTFSNLWLIILDFIDRYMHADKSDLLYEAIPESLKNMLLVMDSAKVFDDDTGNKGRLWLMTWERINKFLPHMKDELFKELHKEDDKEMKQYNIENATRSSIILQPPLVQSTTSHLFAHLGQMVSTPINQPSTMPYLLNQQYNSQLSDKPISLYTEYIDNPYNETVGDCFKPTNEILHTSKYFLNDSSDFLPDNCSIPSGTDTVNDV